MRSVSRFSSTFMVFLSGVIMFPSFSSKGAKSLYLVKKDGGSYVVDVVKNVVVKLH